MVFGSHATPFAAFPHLQTHSKKRIEVDFSSLNGLLWATPSPQSVIILQGRNTSDLSLCYSMVRNTSWQQRGFKKAWTDQEAASPKYNLFSKIRMYCCIYHKSIICKQYARDTFWRNCLFKTNQPTNKEQTIFPEHHPLLGAYLQQAIVSVVKN